MVDMFTFPRITGDTPNQKIAELIDYLVQFKETLEFALMNISFENLSPDLISKLNELGADIKESKENKEEELAQISGNTITLYDVRNEISKINFTVDFDTGYLEYSTS